MRLFGHLTRSTVALSVKALTVLLATIAFYFQDLTIVANEALNNGLVSHILAIPFLFIYLLYRKRKMLRAAITFEKSTRIRSTVHFDEIAGFLLFILVFFLYWYASYTFSPLEYHMLSLPIFVAGLILIIFNSKTLRVLAFPIGFLAFLTPPPIEIAAVATAMVSTLSTEISYAILKTMGLPVSLTTEYYAPGITVIARSGSSIPFVIGEASSGIYSLMGFSIFAAFFTYISIGSLWKRIALFFAGLPLIYTLNILRIISLVSVGYLVGVGVAWDLFHTFGGWFLIFLGTLILLSLSERALKLRLFHAKPTPQLCPQCSAYSSIGEPFCKSCGKLIGFPSKGLCKKDLIKISVIAVSVALILSIQAPVFALTQGPAEALIQTPTGIQAATTILPTVPGYQLRFIYRDTNFETVLKQDAALIYSYTPSNTLHNLSDVVSVGLEIADSKTKFSHWDISLVQWRESHRLERVVNTLEVRELHLLQNPPILARFFAFQWIKSNLTQAVIYWRESTHFKINSSYQQRYTQISVTAYASEPGQYKQTEEKLLAFAQAIVNYWQPIKAWSQIALFISQNGDKLVSTTAALLAVATIQKTYEKRRERNKNANLYRKLPSTSKQIIHAVSETEKTTIPILSNIAATYQERTQATIEKENLLEKLIESEKNGLINSQIASHLDEPILTWETNFSKPLQAREKLQKLVTFFHRSKNSRVA